MKRKAKKFDQEKTDKTSEIIDRILERGGTENPFGIPGWRWFMFDTNVDRRYFYVNDGGILKAGENFSKAEEIKSER